MGKEPRLQPAGPLTTTLRSLLQHLLSILDQVRLAQTIHRALVGIRASVDVVVVTPEDVESLKDGVGTIVGPAMREGREVYAA